MRNGLAQQTLTQLELELLIFEQDVLVCRSRIFARLIELIRTDHSVANLFRIHWLRKIAIDLTTVDCFYNQ